MMKEFIQKTTIFSNNHSFAAEITMPSQVIFKSPLFTASSFSTLFDFPRDLNRVMTVDRTTMTPSHLQSLCMISHESRRMFENNPVKIIEMLPKIQPHLAAKRKEFSAAVGEFQKKKKNI